MTTVLLIGLIIFIVWLFVKNANLDSEQKAQQVSGELRVKYPNFVKAIRKIALTEYYLFADNNKALTYKIPIVTYNRPMGDLYYCLSDAGNLNNESHIILEYRGLDRTVITSGKKYLGKDEDLSIEEYLKKFTELDQEIMSDKRYLKSVTKGFM